MCEPPCWQYKKKKKINMKLDFHWAFIFIAENSLDGTRLLFLNLISPQGLQEVFKLTYVSVLWEL